MEFDAAQEIGPGRGKGFHVLVVLIQQILSPPERAPMFEEPVGDRGVDARVRFVSDARKRIAGDRADVGAAAFVQKGQ